VARHHSAQGASSHAARAACFAANVTPPGDARARLAGGAARERGVGVLLRRRGVDPRAHHIHGTQRAVQAAAHAAVAKVR
jgi:hypothetical protein